MIEEEEPYEEHLQQRSTSSPRKVLLSYPAPYNHDNHPFFHYYPC